MSYSNFRRLVATLLVTTFLSTLFIPGTVQAGPNSTRLFFLHHSTGRNLLDQGDVRLHLDTINAERGTDFVLWDHDYNDIGLKDPAGVLLGYGFDIPDDNTDPDGLYKLWTTNNSARDSILANYDVIAFKSCYPASAITSDAMLDQYKTWYLEIRDVLDQHPDKEFLVMSQPPLHRLGTTVEAADRARAFANWLGSDAFLAGHPNIHYFDFFNRLANADDGSATRNMLRYEYEATHDYAESHPNALANETVGPFFIDALSLAGTEAVAPVADLALPMILHQNQPNPFNPVTRITFELERATGVRLQILTLRGTLVRELVNQALPAGTHEASWNGRDSLGAPVGSGMYLYRLATNDGIVSKKMLLTK